ncbi:unnamed protein product [Paramecium pentaurelia]|uniref:PX domain-containing protein n=1 Tax=Paramecium pentaurelia TaxID=43138 RepID=A0A8S1U1N6_9CILI|nr:unnamed protein product [Paramecium pentaurelia]
MNLLDDLENNGTQQMDLLNFDHQSNMIPNVDFYNAIVINEFMNNRIVEVKDGEVVKEGYITKYKLYLVRTKKQGGDWETEVSRRFSDFEWLYQEMINKYGGYIIPAIPEKHLLTKVNLASYEFSEKRRKDLQQFLQRILNHHHLRYVPELRIFIEDKEKFISLLKGELEQNKTIEQKYDNLLQSVKSLWHSSTMTTKGQDPTRMFDGGEKDLTYDETLLLSLSMKGSKLKTVVEEHIITLREEAKTLNDQNESLYSWNGLGSASEEDISQFKQLKYNNEIRQRKINREIEDIDRKFLHKLQYSLFEIEWALTACKRRRNLQQQLLIDQQRIDQLKMQYTDNSSRRDLEMDVLKTKYQKNKDRSDKMSIIMQDELLSFISEMKQQLKSILEEWRSIMKTLSKNIIEDENE